MSRVLFAGVVGLLLVCSSCGAQENDSSPSKSDTPAEQIKPIAAEIVRALRPDRVLDALVNDNQAESLGVAELGRDRDLLREADWSVGVLEFAESICRDFSAEEQHQLAEFTRSSAGKRLFQLQAGYQARLITLALMLRKSESARLSIPRAIENVLSETTDEGRRAIERAMTETIPNLNRIHGRWYVQDPPSDEVEFTGWHLKRPGGLNTSFGVLVDHQEKTYDRFEEPGLWVARGRVIVEMNFSDLDYVNLFIVESISDTELRWALVDPATPPSQWQRSVETRQPIEMLERPSGYEDPEF